MDGSQIAAEFRRNGQVLRLNLQGLDETQLSLRAGGQGNSIRWIIAHLVLSRLELMKHLEMPGPLDSGELQAAARARPGGYSEDELPDSGRLLALWDTVENKLLEALGGIDPHRPQGESATLEEVCAGYGFHEAYHTGQVGLMRRWAGEKGMIGQPDG